MQAAVTRGATGGNSVTEDSIGARRLWTAVIVHAIDDWRSGTLRARREAQKFLFEDGADFDEVCTCAGLDSGSFRVNLLKIGRRIEMQGPWTHSQAVPAGSPAASEQKISRFLMPSYHHNFHS
jgi:hypothetical protein